MKSPRLALYIILAAIIFIALAIECATATPQVYVRAVCGNVLHHDNMHHCGHWCHQCGQFDIQLYLEGATHDVDGGRICLVAQWPIQVLGLDRGEWFFSGECNPWVSVHKWFYPPSYTAIQMEFHWPTEDGDCTESIGQTLHVATLRCQTRPDTCDWVAFAQWHHATEFYHWDGQQQVPFDAAPLPGHDDEGFPEHVCFVSNHDYGCCPPPAVEQSSWGDIKALYQK